jgi:hypothetical protein
MARSSLTFGLIALAALTLGGCNLVMSDKPVFTPADAEGAAPLRPGVWAAPDAGCAFDEAQPVAAWPKCAGGSVVTPTEAWGADDPSKHNAYVLAAGDPRVLQAVADISTSDNVSAPKGPIYLFLAVKPLASDGQGRIVKAEVWIIQCGPPPPPPKADAKEQPKPEDYATKHPLPGMIMSDGACSPRDKAAVLGAAGPSRAWAEGVMTLHWVRDGTT